MSKHHFFFFFVTQGYNIKILYHRIKHIAIPFICRLKDEDSINVIESEPKYAGDLKWFSKIPKNILKVHDVYQDLFKFYGL